MRDAWLEVKKAEAKAADVRAFRIYEGTTAYFRKEKLVPGDIFPSLREVEYSDAPENEVDPEQSFQMAKRIFKVSG